MQKDLKARLAKALVGTVAAGAMAFASAAPASARDGGIGAGEIIAGALVIGGIAAIASAASKDNDRYGYSYDRTGYHRDVRYDSRRDYRYGNRINSRSAVNQCVRAAENRATRHIRGGHAQVTDIRRVDSKYFGYEVTGRMAVNDRRGWNDRRHRGAASFYCRIANNGRIAGLSFDGIRGL